MRTIAGFVALAALFGGERLREAIFESPGPEVFPGKHELRTLTWATTPA